MIASLLFLASANANNLGIEEVPRTPSDRRPTWRMSEFRSELGDSIEMPQYLVPIGYENHGKVAIRKYFDEDGNVYTAQQVGMILDRCGVACSSAMIEYKRQNSVMMTWTMVSLVGDLLFLPVGVVGAIGAICQLGPVNNAFGRVVKDYNQREDVLTASPTPPTGTPAKEAEEPAQADDTWTARHVPQGS